jgi:hypothetical protein
MSKQRDALARGRDRARRGAPFTPQDLEILAEAALSPGFDANIGTIDAKIERFLIGTYGVNWVDARQRPAPDYTATEQAELAAAEALSAERTAAAAAARAKWMAAEDRVFALPRGTPFEKADQLTLEANTLEQAYHEACEQAERALAVVNDIRKRANERRRREALGAA